jgi:hypothetical protein
MIVRTIAVVLGAMTWLAGCSEPKAPPVVVPPPPPVEVDAGPPPVVDAGVVDPRPDNVLKLPETEALNEDPRIEDQLARLLLRDPNFAEKRLAAEPTPNSWQVALMANFATRRGARELVPPKENPLPSIEIDGGVTQPGPAWVSVTDLALKSLPKKGQKPTVLLSLPIATAVTVDAVDGGVAFISAQVATAVDFDDHSPVPTHVEATTVQGQVPASALVPTVLTAEQLQDQARAQPKTELGQDRALALWHRAYGIDHSDTSREGWLRTAMAAKRSWWTVSAAVAPTFGPASNLAVAWACRGDPVKAKWVRWPVGKTAPADVCVTQVSEQPSCEEDPPKVAKRLDDDAQARKDSGLTPSPVLSFTVDARTVHHVFLSASKLELQDACGDFPQLKVESWGANLRRLTLPLGTSSVKVRVPAPGYHGYEYSIITAASELKAAAWLRSRSHIRWTMGHGGELEPSLSTGDNGFRLEPDVQAESYAISPVRPCHCDD